MSSFRLQTRQLTFVRILIPFIAGIIVGCLWQLDSLVYWLLLLLGVSILILTTHLNRTINKTKWRKYKGLFINLSFILIGFCCSGLHNELNHKTHFKNSSDDYFIIQIDEPPIRKGANLKFKAEVIYAVKNSAQKSVSGNLLVTLNTKNELKYGQLLLISNKINAINPPQNPYEFDYRRYLYFKNIHFQTYLKTNEYRLIKSDAKFSVLTWAIAMREKCVQVFNRYIPSHENASITAAFLLGYRADLSSDVVTSFTNTGTLHILSVSGLHVTIIFLVINTLLSFLDRIKHGKLIKTILVLLLIWLYALITGMSPAVCRSAFMISVVAVAQGFNRYTNIYNTIAVSVFFLLLLDPYLLFDVGFQLSYIAVWGIIYFQPKIYKWFYTENKALNYLWTMTSVSISAQLATFPLSIYYFHQFPNYFLIANILVIPIASIILFGGILLLGVSFIPSLAGLIGLCLTNIIDLMNWILLKLSHLPFATFNGIWINNYTLLLLTLIVFSIGYRLSEKSKTALNLSFILIIFFIISFSFENLMKFKENELVIFSVKGKTVIACKDQNRLQLIADPENLSKSYAFSIKPYIEHSNSQVSIDSLGSNLKSAHLVKHKNYLQFYDIRIGIVDEGFIVPESSQKLKVDYLLISGKKRVDVKTLLNIFEFNTLLIDKSISEYNANKIMAQCQMLGINSINIYQSNALRISI
ncbi:ComEC family competence protein [Solitalea sp. MAHUQ-68]|uniref:ComEC family competence protein n=1 Tax=Solitalea agri TaxID=2953739 RepID=A0A9X2EZM9_9SPHI|nr:ComEC/Rec2 family competence protein [Solitalea agri]MCO4291365.1 ComEC family competence protein [Solitalea agri]